MKLFELYQPTKTQLTEDDELDLLLTANKDDSQLLAKIEKALKSAAELEPEVDDHQNELDAEGVDINEAQDNTSRIDSIKQLLADRDDNEMLDRIESILKAEAINKRVEKMFKARGWLGGSARMDKYMEPFSEAIQIANASVKSKIQLLHMFTRNSPALQKETFASPFHSTINKILPPQIASNECWLQIWKKIFTSDTFKGKGIGPAEFGLILVGKDGQKTEKRGDIFIGGWGIEIKSGAGGSMKPGSVDTKFRGADEAAANLAKVLGVKIAGAKAHASEKFTIHQPSALVDAVKARPEKEQLKVISDWANALWPGIKQSDRIALCKNIVKTLGTQEVYQHIGQTIMVNYQEKDNWDSILFFQTSGGRTGEMINVSDPTDPDGAGLLDYTPVLTRGGNTQALPDGYANAKIPSQASMKKREQAKAAIAKAEQAVAEFGATD